MVGGAQTTPVCAQVDTRAKIVAKHVVPSVVALSRAEETIVVLVAVAAVVLVVVVVAIATEAAEDLLKI